VRARPDCNAEFALTRCGLPGNGSMRLGHWRPTHGGQVRSFAKTTAHKFGCQAESLVRSPLRQRKLRPGLSCRRQRIPLHPWWSRPLCPSSARLPHSISRFRCPMIALLLINNLSFILPIRMSVPQCRTGDCSTIQYETRKGMCPSRFFDPDFIVKGEIVDGPFGRVDAVSRSAVRSNTDFQNEYHNPNSW
jgi:hypothetical protein